MGSACAVRHGCSRGAPCRAGVATEGRPSSRCSRGCPQHASRSQTLPRGSLRTAGDRPAGPVCQGHRARGQAVGPRSGAAKTGPWSVRHTAGLAHSTHSTSLPRTTPRLHRGPQRVPSLCVELEGCSAPGRTWACVCRLRSEQIRVRGPICMEFSGGGPGHGRSSDTGPVGSTKARPCPGPRESAPPPLPTACPLGVQGHTDTVSAFARDREVDIPLPVPRVQADTLTLPREPGGLGQSTSRPPVSARLTGPAVFQVPGPRGHRG